MSGWSSAKKPTIGGSRSPRGTPNATPGTSVDSTLSGGGGGWQDWAYNAPPSARTSAASSTFDPDAVTPYVDPADVEHGASFSEPQYASTPSPHKPRSQSMQSVDSSLNASYESGGGTPGLRSSYAQQRSAERAARGDAHRARMDARRRDFVEASSGGAASKKKKRGRLSCGVKLAKALLACLNLVVLLIALGVVGFGGYAAAKSIHIHANGESVAFTGKDLGVGVVVVGAFIALVSIVAFVGACCENRVLLVVFMVLMALMLLVEIGGVIVAFGFNSVFEGFLSNVWSHADAKTQHDLEHVFDCCGFDKQDTVEARRCIAEHGSPSPSSHAPSPSHAPSSFALLPLATVDDATALAVAASSSNSTQPCYGKLKSWLTQKSHLLPAIGVLCGLALVQLATIVIAGCLVAGVRRKLKAEKRARREERQALVQQPSDYY